MSLIKQTHRDALKEIFGGAYTGHVSKYLIDNDILTNNQQPYSVISIRNTLNGTNRNLRITNAVQKLISEERKKLLISA